MNQLDFTFEFYNEAELLQSAENQLFVEAETRLRDLTGDHKDMTGASISVDEVSSDTTPHRYEVRVIVYMRPDDVVATEKHETAIGALKGALSAVERQVREYRNKLREHWKQP